MLLLYLLFATVVFQDKYLELPVIDVWDFEGFPLENVGGFYGVPFSVFPACQCGLGPDTALSTLYVATYLTLTKLL